MKIIASASRRAFTLPEIMIVVAVIGVVSSIAIPNFTKSKEIAVKNTCLANIRQLGNALTLATSETNASVGDLSEDGIRATIEPDYINRMPLCSRGNYSTDGSGEVHCSVHVPSA